MRKLLITTTVLFITLFSIQALAQGTDTMPPSEWKEESPQLHAERGLSLMVKGDFEKAFKALFGKNPLEKLKFEIYSLAKKQGNPLGYELVLNRKLGTRLNQFRYILFFQKQPILLEFTYYKRNTGWTLRDVHFSKKARTMFLD